MFHLRWLLLLAAVLAAVINPVITSPFVYPLFTWSVAVQACVYSAVASYAFVAIYAMCTAVAYDRHRPLSVLSVAVFFVIGWLYVVLHFTLHTFAFIKVFTGRVGGWQVTERSIKGISPTTAIGATSALAVPLLGSQRQRVDLRQQ